MSSVAPPRVRPRLLVRFQCSRTGHRWERQILDSGAEARWVCSACGKLGDAIPVITPDQEVVHVTEEPITDAAQDAVTGDSADTGSPAAQDAEAVPESAEAPVEPEPVDDVVSAAPAEAPRRSRLRRRPVLTAAAAGIVLATAAGVAVVALRRRR